MSGYPDQYNVPTRNRQYSNQPGGLAKPEQVMVQDFTPDSPESNHMRSQADAMRVEPTVEVEMNYEVSNQPSNSSGEYDDAT